MARAKSMSLGMYPNLAGIASLGALLRDYQRRNVHGSIRPKVRVMSRAMAWSKSISCWCSARLTWPLADARSRDWRSILIAMPTFCMTC